MDFFSKLREANQTRQREWDPKGFACNLDWRITELGGELGEALNLLKKFHRERCGIPGSRATRAHLAEELADVVICVDLVAAEAGLTMPLNPPRVDSDLVDYLPACGRHMLSIMGVIALPDQRPHVLNSALNGLAGFAYSVASKFGLDLTAAVVAKFNATSEKVGLSTRLEV